jgi:hypothetical protein
MTRLFVILFCLICFYPATVWSLIFESQCQSLDAWTFIDYTGDLNVDILDDFSCPPGYGPKVMQIHGDVAMGLATSSPLQEGTFVALYKENTPAVEDADGVIMVWADYGQDTSTEHNAKIKRAHVWLEQDNDLGFQFRVIDSMGKEFPIEERVGVGLVTDSWNQTNWIWQKVQIKGNTLRAKYWPAETEEPNTWAIETSYPLKGNRFGLRINSGSIRVAYFAADTQDIHPKAPLAYLFSAQDRLTDPTNIPLKLFTNSQIQREEKLDIRITCDNKVVEKSEIVLDVPNGHHEFPILITMDHTISTSNEVVHVPNMLSPGLYKVTLSNSAKDFSTQCVFEIIAPSRLQKQIKEVNDFLADLEKTIQPLNKNTERIKTLNVILTVAHSHLHRAKALLDLGKTSESEASFRFVIEALSELHGYKGEWLKELGVTLNLDFIPDSFEHENTINESTNGVVDFYSPNYQLYFHSPKSDTRSMVMGRTYEIEIPWSFNGDAIDRDFNFHVRMLSPLGNRVVAESNRPPNVPTHLWKPGNIYSQFITLNILAEDAIKRPQEPVILDEWHHLLVTVTDPESGASVLLGNEPGDQTDRVGHSFLLDRIYVSSTPLEIRQFNPTQNIDSFNGSHSAVVTLNNCGEQPQSIDAVLTVTSESGRILNRKIQPAFIPADSNQVIQFDWASSSVGKLFISIQLMRDGITLTQASQELIIDPPSGIHIEIQKQNHVEKRDECFVTPIFVHVQGNNNPINVKVYADGRLVGEKVDRSESIVVYAEPWFGYYDIQVECDSFSYEKRIVATVVETAKKDLLVNGEPFIIKGVNVHGLDSGSPERTASMMRIMRNLGFNAWRGDYPARWQMELAYRLNSVYTVLAPFSCARTPEIFGRQAGPPLGTARELTSLFIDRYKDSAGVLMWNSCNEIIGENIDFLLSLYPLYKTYDPYQRPVHYANLYGQDLWQGQDAMGVKLLFC